jgi:hypothetical protein
MLYSMGRALQSLASMGLVSSLLLPVYAQVTIACSMLSRLFNTDDCLSTSAAGHSP